jgi:hypothetical protein
MNPSQTRVAANSQRPSEGRLDFSLISSVLLMKKDKKDEGFASTTAQGQTRKQACLIA